uniref:Protein kinase domain-containing protein n=1 Tax=Oryza brachyantha TaxID=4533 RepID=J3L0Q5_ORYBR
MATRPCSREQVLLLSNHRLVSDSSAGLHMDCHNLQSFLKTNGNVVLQRVENNYSLRYFTENEVRHITNGYGVMLGKGSFGEVYKGVLDDQCPVAVKRYIHGAKKEEFAKEVIVHSQINHRNVVRLLGCCTEENALMIVMEFISNGNLNNILHCSNTNSHVPFPLGKRLDIAIQVADVLWCMHSMYSPILHGDIKPANILLDENLSPKISDFGIARLLCANGAQHTKNIIGSIGYVDPAFCKNGILTPKSDVYSFGVVLLEIITRKKAVDGTITLAENFTEVINKRKEMMHLFDQEINNTENLNFLKDIGKLAVKCLSRDVEVRLEMVEVATGLRMIRKALEEERGNLIHLQHISALKNLIHSKNVRSEARQFGNLNIFKKKEIKHMTRKYSMKFREDSREHLYYGVIGKARAVIVKQVSTSSESDRDVFLKTMGIVSQKYHKNVANVAGFHLGESVSECVYESCCDLSQRNDGHVSFYNRNLYEIICSRDKLPLHLRLSIAVQCAEGLVHIHSLLSENPDSRCTGLLGNFSSKNIFLDKNFVPKVFNSNLSTFLGLSVMEQHTTSVDDINDHGSQIYYLDQRDVSGQLPNPKSDVYSFGVVLLELITWKTVRYMSGGGVHMLTTDFLDTYKKNHSAAALLGQKVYDEQGNCFIHEAIDIAVACLEPDIQRRTEMSNVLSRLRTISAAQSIRSKLIMGTQAKADGDGKSNQHTATPVKINAVKTPTITASTISMDMLRKITRNFSNDVLIGQGSGARVFLGVLEDGNKSAVKEFVSIENIAVQVQTISGIIRHSNVAQILGYFIEGKQLILVYEYAPNGSLHDILHGKKGVTGAQPGIPLSWKQRVKIALSAAKGLEFLHEKAVPPVIHTNIKSSNILLFGNDVAKIGDLGVTEHLVDAEDDLYYDSGIHTFSRRFDDYYAPEYLMTGQYSVKGDVYNFGKVLLELLTGRKVVDRTLPHGQQSLVVWATPRLNEERVGQLVDPKLGKEFPFKSVAKVITLKP